MKRILPSLLVLAAIATFVVPATARAWLIMVEFKVLADPNDPVHRGETASGSFTFDSSLIRSLFPGVPYENWRTTGWHIPSLSFTWDEHEWTTLDADLVAIGTDANGDFYSWAIGGKPKGLNSTSGGTPDFWATPFSFHYATTYGGTFFGSTTSWTSSPVRVPEPGTLLSLAPWLLAVLLRRRSPRTPSGFDARLGSGRKRESPAGADGAFDDRHDRALYAGSPTTSSARTRGA